MPAWLDHLRRRFSPQLLRVGTDATQPLGGGMASPLVLVGRELCLFLAVDATRVPVRQRSAFVQLAVRRAAPFHDPEHDVLWRNGRAAVWYWSRERVRAQTGAPARFRAEALHRGELPVSDGAELLTWDASGSAGESPLFEARVWKDGALAASRCWRELPAEPAWQAFARGAGIDPRVPMPDPTRTALRRRALGEGRQGPLLAAGTGAQRTLLLAGAGALVAMALAWQAASAAKVAWRVHLVERETSRLSRAQETMIAARERADAARARIDAALSLRAPASQTQLLAEVSRITPGAWQLMSWNQPAPDALDVTLRIANADVPAIVSAWEASPFLQEVTPASSSRTDEVRIQARLTPLQKRLLEESAR